MVPLLLRPVSEGSVLEHGISIAAGGERREDKRGRGGGGYIMVYKKLGKEGVMPLLVCCEPSNRRNSNSNEPTKPAIVRSSSSTTPSRPGRSAVEEGKRLTLTWCVLLYSSSSRSTWSYREPVGWAASKGRGSSCSCLCNCCSISSHVGSSGVAATVHYQRKSTGVVSQRGRWGLTCSPSFWTGTPSAAESRVKKGRGGGQKKREWEEKYQFLLFQFNTNLHSNQVRSLTASNLPLYLSFIKSVNKRSFLLFSLYSSEWISAVSPTSNLLSCLFPLCQNPCILSSFIPLSFSFHSLSLHPKKNSKYIQNEYENIAPRAIIIIKDKYINNNKQSK